MEDWQKARITEDEYPQQVNSKSDASSPLERTRSRYLESADIVDEKVGLLAASQNRRKSSRKESMCSCLTFLEGQLLLLLMVCIAIILFLTAMIVIYNDKQEICLSSWCTQDAARHLALMNLDIDPCEDFYNYACANFNKSHNPEPGVGKFSRFYEAYHTIDTHLYTILDNAKIKSSGFLTAVDKMTSFFKSCMDRHSRASDGAKPLLSLMKTLGGWTLTAPKKSSSWDLADTLIEMLKLNVDPLFAFDVDTDPQDSTRYMIHLLATNLNFYKQIELQSKDTKYKKNFLNYVVRLGKLLDTDVNSDTLESMAKEIWEFEVNLSHLRLNPTQQRDPLQIETRTTVGEAEKSIMGDRFPLTKILNRLDSSISASTAVILHDKEYFSRMSELVKSTSSDLLANYFMLKTILTFEATLDNNFETLATIKTNVFVGSVVSTPPWKKCVKTTNKFFSLPLTSVYLSAFQNEINKISLADLVKAIKSSLSISISDATWMDDATRKLALKKVDNIDYAIGYPTESLTSKQMDADYSDVQLAGTSYFTNYVEIKRHTVYKLIKRLKQEVDRKEFSKSPLTPNAYFNQQKLVMVLLLGLLRDGFYDKGASDASNFGSLGYIIGHELSHGFDSRGKLYDANGNRNNWWTDATTKAFSKREECFVNQYSAFSFSGVAENARLTLGENIADNAGLLVAFRAFVKSRAWSKSSKGDLPGLHLNEEQVFFLSFAQTYCGTYTPQYAQHSMSFDVHSPYPVRVQAALSNSKQFARAFKCKAGSKYNPTSKCDLW